MWFWKQSDDCPHSPDEVVEGIVEKQIVLSGVESFDLEQVKLRFKEVFPGLESNLYQTESCYFNLDLYPPYGFQVISTPPGTEEVMDLLNQIIDLAGEFGCALYDPQAGQRFA